MADPIANDNGEPAWAEELARLVAVDGADNGQSGEPEPADDDAT